MPKFTKSWIIQFLLDRGISIIGQIRIETTDKTEEWIFKKVFDSTC